jgi:2,4-dienoyl-CoA reductase (NADPH2)
MALMMEKAGVAGFDLVPAWHEGGHSAINYFMPDGAWVYLAEEMKKFVKVPVTSGMRLADPWIAEEALLAGRADQVCWGRALIADPELPKKIREGRLDDIRMCLVCNRCGDFVDKDVKCQVNARVGHEGEYSLEDKAAKPKKVAIVGGGAAGMEAARIAALRGHKVVLYEKEKALGGNLNPAAVPPMKFKLGQFRDYLITQIKKLGVEIRLGKEVKAGDLVKESPDVVIVATGAREIIPNIIGIRSAHVVSAIDVLLGRKEVGNQVVIIGSGLIGCEVASYLAAKKVSKIMLVEALDKIGPDIPRVIRWELLQNLRNAGVAMETRVNVEEITPMGVRGRQKGKVVFYNADSVVIAAGLFGESKLAGELKGKINEVYTIGDCVSPRRIMEAVEEGFKTGLRI